MRVGVVGMGKMGLLHASILNVLEGVKLVALCEKSSIVRRFAGRIIPDISVVGDVGELAGMKLDAVYVTTPEFAHFPIIETVYKNGIARHVFVEKPLASSYAEARQLSESAARAGGIAMVGYNRRYSVTFGKAKQILTDDILGELSSFEGHAFSSDFLEARFDSPASARALALSDLGCHVIDLALWLFGPLEASSGLLESSDGNMPNDWVRFHVSSSGSSKTLQGDLSVSRCMASYRLPEMSLCIRGSKGTMKVDEDKVELNLKDGGRSLWHKHDLDDHVPFFIGGAEYVREDVCFINAIQASSRAEPDFQAASHVESIIEHVTSGKEEIQSI